MQTTNKTFRCFSHRKALGCVGNKFWCCWYCLFGEKLHASRFDPAPGPSSSRAKHHVKLSLSGCLHGEGWKAKTTAPHPWPAARTDLATTAQLDPAPLSKWPAAAEWGLYNVSKVPCKRTNTWYQQNWKKKSNADNFKPWLLVDLFLRALWRYCPPHVWPPLCYLQTKGFQGRGRSQPKKEKGCIHVQWKSTFTPTMFSDHYWSFGHLPVLPKPESCMDWLWLEMRMPQRLQKRVSASGRRWWW